MTQYVIDLAPYGAARQWSISWACVPSCGASALVKFYVADYAQRMEAIPQARSPEALYGQILAVPTARRATTSSSGICWTRPTIPFQGTVRCLKR